MGAMNKFLHRNDRLGLEFHFPEIMDTHDSMMLINDIIKIGIRRLKR